MAQLKIEALENVDFYQVEGLPLENSKVTPTSPDGSAIVNFEEEAGKTYRATIVAVNKAGTSPAFTTEPWTAPIPVPPPGQPVATIVE
jgi:hypothetical protein